MFAPIYICCKIKTIAIYEKCFMTEFFNAYEKVSHWEMGDLALEIMYEWDEQSNLEAARSNMLSSMNSAKISSEQVH